MTKKPLTVLSLFDGISCARVALKRARIQVKRYYASEVDKYAIEIAQARFPDTIQLGDITKITGKGLHKVDLIIGGSPCQDLSIANTRRKGLKGKRSGLFYEYVRILKEVKPRYFILENVASMPKESRDMISKVLGVEPIMIDASLVSAQSRRRLFWTNIKGIKPPKDRKIVLNDILHETRGEKFDLEKYKISGKHLKWIKNNPERIKKKFIQLNGGKAIPMMARQYANWNGQYVIVPEATKAGFAIAQDGDSIDFSFPNSKTRRGRVGKKAKNIMTSSTVGVFKNGYIRKLTPTECERLQCLPKGHTNGVTDSCAYKMLGNAFNVDVVAHILKHI